MKVSSYIAEVIAAKKVPVVFELVGGTITHLLDALYLRGTTRIVSMRHEQGAAFAAEAAGRISGVPGVALATSGPGATNLLTGIGSCYFDSTPAVFLTGQVNRYEQKNDRAIRQLGFQETDIVTMAEPITKRAWRVESEEQIPRILEEAFRVAMSGRKGPVLVDIPMDVQRMDIGGEMLEEAARFPPTTISVDRSNQEVLNQIADGLRRARRPMILCGGGIRSSGALEAFRQFVHAAQIPVVNSLMAVDVLPFGDPLRVGMIGAYGNRWANLALTQSDCVLVLGSRLDIRQTGSATEAFQKDRTIFHIDCEPGEMNNRITGCIAMCADLDAALQALTDLFPMHGAAVRAQEPGWLEQIDLLREQWPDTAELAAIEGINPNRLMHDLSRRFERAGAYVADVGQHQMWAAQSLELNARQRFLTSGGMGSMGFALPAAIGAAVCLPGQAVVMIAGDGGFQCNIQELQTIAHHGLPVKMVVINNQCHGMVRQFQETYFERRYQSTVWGYSAPDFQKIACAYGIPAKTVADPAHAAEALDWLAEDASGPALLQVMVSPQANAWPKVAFGRGLESMEPLAEPVGMEAT